MENQKSLISPSGRAALLAACLIFPAHGGERLDQTAPADRELSKRYQSVEEAQELLRKGDEAYEDGRYAEAVEAFSGARDLTPEAPATAEFRAALTERYVQASIQHGRGLARKGDLAGARTAVEKVLSPSVAPGDPAALAFRAELDDPIRTNPALTAEHAGKVDQVRRLLYTAEGAYQLGDFDKAKTHYEEVLRIDPTNSASRRGLERVASAKSGYYDSAYDHARAEMLNQVEKAWELDVEPEPVDINPADPDGASPGNVFIPISSKLSRIIIPSVNLQQTTLQEAIDFLRLRSAEYDTLELDPARRGVNFNLNLGDSSAAREIAEFRFDLRLANVPLAEVLRYLTDLTRTSYRTDDYSVIIQPHGTAVEGLITRAYKVTPDFLSNLGGSTAAETTASNDPFAEAPSGGLLPKRLGATELLTQAGVPFPEGASATFNAPTNTLRVVNTAANHDIIAQIVESVTQTEPVLVKVNVTIIKTEQRNLKELGFDWLLGNFGFGGEIGNGFDNLNLTGGTRGTGGDLSDMTANGSTPGNPITAGNRSGDGATSGNSIDAIIEGGNVRPGQSNLRAPGVFSIYGLLGDTAVNMLMRGLDQKKGVDLMHKPSVITRSAQAASIEVIREFPYPTAYEPPELPNNIDGTDRYEDGVLIGSYGPDSVPVTPSHPTDFKTEKVGVVLEVLPTADSAKRFIDVTLNPTVKEFDGFINYGSPINTPARGVVSIPGVTPSVTELTENAILQPVFNVMRTSTSISIADGATIVIGGLMQDSIQNVEDHTPVLGTLPVVGRLFQSKAKQPVTTAVVFLVNVELVDPTGRPFRDR